MDIQGLWDKALKQTEIVRGRVAELSSIDTTALPYVFLAESALNEGDTVVRSGQVMIERPSLILPTARFEGFDFERELASGDDAVLNFLLVRGIRFPSMRYRHELSSREIREGELTQSVKHFRDQIARREDVHTGLVVDPEDAWQFSILILVANAAGRSAEGDLRRLLDEWQRGREGGAR